MKPSFETMKPDDDNEALHWETAAAAPKKQLSAEGAQEARELRRDLAAIKNRIEELAAAVKAMKLAPLTTEEVAARAAKILRMVNDSEARGSHPEITDRIRKVAGEQFDKMVFERQVAESPEGRELERLKNRQFDMNDRLAQIESGE